MRRQSKQLPSQSPGPHRLADLPRSKTQATVLATLPGCRTGREMTRFCLFLHLGSWGGHHEPWQFKPMHTHLGAQSQGFIAS